MFPYIEILFDIIGVNLSNTPQVRWKLVPKLIARVLATSLPICALISNWFYRPLYLPNCFTFMSIFLTFSCEFVARKNGPLVLIAINTLAQQLNQAQRDKLIKWDKSISIGIVVLI